ncbi:MAG: hypothetical protein SW833_14820 [Cyanobacteriota bacterium]|nr:hypothetical protein [Cyanobacteriota bacterium]
MLDISFYTDAEEPAERIEVAEAFLEWLARSKFSQIGKDCSTRVIIDEEEIIIPLVELKKSTRSQFVDFFNETIVEETKKVLDRLDSLSPSVESVYRLRKLIELLDCFKNESYQYLQRI